MSYHLTLRHPDAARNSRACDQLVKRPLNGQKVILSLTCQLTSGPTMCSSAFPVVTAAAGTLAGCARLPLGALALLHLARQCGLYALILLLLVQQLGAQVRDLRLHIRIAARPT